MSTERKYTIRLKGLPEPVTVYADDVEMEHEGTGDSEEAGPIVGLNFTKENNEGDDVTVAVVPWDQVVLVTS